MANSHLVAVRAAEKTGRDLKNLFARMGTREHPRGLIFSAYRNVRRGMKDALAAQSLAGRRIAATEVLGGFRREGRSAMQELLQGAHQVGVHQATTEAGAYNLTIADEVALRDSQVIETAWLSTLDSQISNVQALVAMGVDPALIIGDDHRMGLLTPGPVARAGSRWIPQAMITAWLGLMLPPAEQSGLEFSKQAVAGIDERTTECCLRVHAQVQPLDGLFDLTGGEPRYADYLPWVGFHWY